MILSGDKKYLPLLSSPHYSPNNPPLPFLTVTSSSPTPYFPPTLGDTHDRYTLPLFMDSPSPYRGTHRSVRLDITLIEIFSA